MSKKVCLVDGSGYIFRAFYALPMLTTPQGVPVNAVLGFMNMFMRLTAKIKCDYCLVLFDAKRQNFRNDIFADYKGTRKETPIELIPQFPIIHKAVEVLNLNHLEMEGFEADDLIATYAKKAIDKGYEVVIVSADKDLMQLIRPGVEFYDSMKDKFFSPEDVKEKFGVYPDKVVDVQALAGDATDNVPGVPGIGLKTAAELINQFGSLDEVLERASEIKQNKRRETLLANIENARVSKQLVELKADVEVAQDIDTYACKPPVEETVMAFVDEYDLKSIKARVQKWIIEQKERCGEQIVQNKEPEKFYELVQDEETLKKWINLAIKNRKFAIDTETTGLNPFEDKIVGFSMATDVGKACYVPLLHKTQNQMADLFGNTEEQSIKQLSFETVKKYLKPLLESKSVLKIGHNIKFDMHFLSQIVGNETSVFPIEDTAIISYNLDSSEHGHGLDELAELFLDYNTIKYEDVCGSGKNKISFDYVLPEKALDYAAEDADITLRLYEFLKPRLQKEKQTAVYEIFDRPLVQILKDMEQEGIMLDTKELLNLNDEFVM